MATTPSYRSMRVEDRGSWFIHSLCQNLVKLVPRGQDLARILTTVHNDVGNKSNRIGGRRQMPQHHTSLRTRLVFPVPEGPLPSPYKLRDQGPDLSDKQLLEVVKTLGQEWEQVAIHLEMDDIKADGQTDVAMQKLKMLAQWRRRRPPGEATAEDLLRALEDLEDLPVQTLELLTGELRWVRSAFVQRVSYPVIKGLLDDLWQQKVFSAEEKDFVMEGQRTRADQARCLIDMVIGKGERASQIMIDCMKVRDKHLSITLGLMSYPAGGLKAEVKLKRLFSRARDKKIRSAGQDLSNKQLLQVAETLGQEWEQAAIHLELSITDLDDIKADRQTDVAMQKLKMLVLWKHRSLPGEATAQDLLRGLEDLEDLPVETRLLLEGRALSNEQLLKVAETLGKVWERAAIHLDLKTKDLDGIKAENMTVIMQKYKMLQLWQSQRPLGKDRAQDLLRGLEDMEDLPVETLHLLRGFGRNQESFGSGQEHPGRMSPSLPLEMHEGDRELDKVFETRSPGQDLSAEQLQVVARTLGKRWEKAALHLGLKNEVLEDIKKEEIAEFMQRRKMLRLWKEQRPGKATAQDLLRGLEGLKVLPDNTRRSLEGFCGNPSFSSGQESYPGPTFPKIPSHKPLMTSGSSGQGSLSKSELSGPVDSESSLPFAMHGSTQAGEKTKRKSCNRSPGKAKAKDPVRGMKGQEGIPVETHQLLKDVGQDLTDNQLLKVAEKLGKEWKPAAIYLGLKPKDLDDIMAKHRTLLHDKYKMLVLWKHRRPPGKAKAQDLLRGLEKLKDLPVEARQLLKELVQNRSKPGKKKKPSCSSAQGSHPGELSSSPPLKKPASDGMLGPVQNRSKPVKKKLSCSSGQGSLPGELSSSLPLKMPASDGMLGNLSDPTVGKPRKSKRGELQGIHSEFVKKVKISVIRGLLGDLWQQKVFSTEDKDSVMEKGKIKTDIARCLIDMVIRKGEKASRIMIDSMKKRDPDLCSTLGLIASPAGLGQISDKTVVKPRTKNKGELQRIHYEFVKTVKIAVIRGLLDDLLQQKVFSTEDKDSVMEKGKIKTDRARCLIDMVIGKGEKQSRIMIKSMKKRDPDLCSTLGLISSPAGVGQISNKTVVKPRTKNKGELQRIHSEFVKTVKIAVIKGLLDDLLQQKVFSTEDKDSVMEKGKIKTDMARCLIDMVIGKGEKQSRIMIERMKKRDRDLCSTLGLISSPAGVGQISNKTVVKPRTKNKGELQRIHSEFVKTVKIAVIKGLLDDLLQQKVFSTEDKDSVMEKGKIKTDMARCLIDMVIGKGEKQSRIMIESMKNRDRDLCSTLGLISSPAGVGQISDKTVVKPRTQNKGELQRIHSEFVKTVKIAVIKGLLDDLLQQKVFSTEDKDSVMEKGKIKTDMARCLIDMVIRKGERASRIMIESMMKRDPDLCPTLGLIASPAGVGHTSDKTEVKPRKQNKGNGGLKRNGSKSEEVANKKPCTVDVSDSITETHSTGQTLTDKELMNVADTLGQEWEPAAIHLELTTKDLDDIKAEHRPVAMQKLMMLVRWKGRRPPGKATAQDLLNCLTDLKHLPVETHQLLTELMKCHSELDGSVQRKQ
ncbi:uncharacterized protein LOC115560655 [Gadus morhua]|uniref:uncharacterized protein LOC115560655 n=1 Tax=Gadus morhua TaxID=8049 RepID=UPI0011B4D280|nr:uncharacterized protein LOC115560655 [Gadus morhua]